MDLKGLILGLRKLSFKPERTDFKPERAILGSESVNLKLKKGLGGNVCTDRTDIWKFTPVPYWALALWGRCLKSLGPLPKKLIT